MNKQSGTQMTNALIRTLSITWMCLALCLSFCLMKGGFGAVYADDLLPGQVLAEADSDKIINCGDPQILEDGATIIPDDMNAGEAIVYASPAVKGNKEFTYYVDVPSSGMLQFSYYSTAAPDPKAIQGFTNNFYIEESGATAADDQTTISVVNQYISTGGVTSDYHIFNSAKKVRIAFRVLGVGTDYNQIKFTLRLAPLSYPDALEMSDGADQEFYIGPTGSIGAQHRGYFTVNIPEKGTLSLEMYDASGLKAPINLQTDNCGWHWVNENKQVYVTSYTANPGTYDFTLLTSSPACWIKATFTAGDVVPELGKLAWFDNDNLTLEQEMTLSDKIYISTRSGENCTFSTMYGVVSVNEDGLVTPNRLGWDYITVKSESGETISLTAYVTKVYRIEFHPEPGFTYSEEDVAEIFNTKFGNSRPAIVIKAGDYFNVVAKPYSEKSYVDLLGSDGVLSKIYKSGITPADGQKIYGFGLKSFADYAALSEARKDIYSTELMPEDTWFKVYALAEQPIDQVDLSVEGPAAGTEIAVEESGPNVVPEAVIPDGSNYVASSNEEGSTISSMWFAGDVNFEDDPEPFSGTIQNGGTYTAMFSIAPKLGYCFPEDTSTMTVTVNGSPADAVYYMDNSDLYDGNIIVLAKVKATGNFAEKIVISGISHKIAAGKKIQLTAKISPSDAAQTVTWKSSNTKIATVSSTGLVTVKKKTGGKTVTITATAADGSGVKATYKIKSMKYAVTKLAVTGAKSSLKAGKTMKLKAKVTAKKGANTAVKWTTSNKKYATVTSKGVVKALKAGKGKTVKITCKTTDGSNKKKVIKIKIK